MGLLRWIGGIVVFFWLLGLIFRIGGRFIHLLLIVAAVVFIFDAITGRRKTTRNGERDRG
jgi:4-hydroxybenzoate polyprenyltransferase